MDRKERRKQRHSEESKPSKFELFLDAVVAALSFISIFKKNEGKDQ